MLILWLVSANRAYLWRRTKLRYKPHFVRTAWCRLYTSTLKVAVQEGRRVCWHFCKCYCSFNALSFYIICMKVYLLQWCLCYDLLLAFMLLFPLRTNYCKVRTPVFFVSCLGTPSRCLYILVFCQTGACDLRVLPPVRQSHCFIFSHTSLSDSVES